MMIQKTSQFQFVKIIHLKKIRKKQAHFKRKKRNWIEL